LSSLCALLAASSSSAAGGRRRKKKQQQQQQQKKGIMAWNEVNEVDASKGIYTVCGKLWLGMYVVKLPPLPYLPPPGRRTKQKKTCTLFCLGLGAYKRTRFKYGLCHQQHN
jgi:hypothetical protein